MSLFEQKYPNNIRTIVGLINIPFQDDVVLECDTALSPVAVQLVEIPANAWSTQYKLYIVDKSNNASINNITITAPIGYKINGLASVTINANSGSYLIRVASNTAYVGQYSSGVSGGVGYNLIKDEGVALPVRTTINFVGAGVTATDVAGETQVSVIGGFISLTNAQMLTLISTNAVIPDQNYLITDAGLCTGGGVIVKGLTTNSTTVGGSGLFLNADYQKVGNYSGVIGFGGNLGIWSTSPLVLVPNDVVVWNNLHWKNLTGVWGTSPDTDVVNWSLLPLSQTNGYILECDVVRYDVVINSIVYRADKRLNEVEYAIFKGLNTLSTFQWGRDLCLYNMVLGVSEFMATNSNCYIGGNFLDSGILYDATEPLLAGSIVNNKLFGGKLYCSKNRGTIENNTIFDGGYIEIANVVDTLCAIYGNFVESGSKIELKNVIAPSFFGSGQCNENNLSQSSSLGNISADCSGIISRNTISNKSTLTFNDVSGGASITKNEVSGENNVTLDLVTSVLEGYKICSGYSDWEGTLDWSDPTIYDSLTKTITIPTSLAFVGLFHNINNAGKSMSKIAQAPSNHKFRMRATATSSTVLRIFSPIVSVVFAVANDIIANEWTVQNAPNYNAFFRVDGCDEMEFEKLGIFVGWTNKNFWV